MNRKRRSDTMQVSNKRQKTNESYTESEKLPHIFICMMNRLTAYEHLVKMTNKKIHDLETSINILQTDNEIYKKKITRMCKIIDINNSNHFNEYVS